MRFVAIWMLIQLSFLAGFHSVSHAQMEGDDYFEDDIDEDFNEQPYNDPGIDNSRVSPPPPPSSQPSPNNNFRGNFPNSGTSNPVRPATPGPSFPPPRGGGHAGSTDEVEFKLIDPPKYWKPKKRRAHRPL